MAKKTTKAPVKKAASKKAPAKKTVAKAKKPSVKFDVNKDGKVDIEDVKIVMEEANKAKKVTKKPAKKDYKKEKQKFVGLLSRCRKVHEVESLASDIFGKTKVIWENSRQRAFSLELESGEKFPKDGFLTI